MLSFNALLLIPKRIIPAPRRHRVTGQGKDQPKSGLGILANIIVESTVNNTPAVIRIHFDAFNMFIFATWTVEHRPDRTLGGSIRTIIKRGYFLRSIFTLLIFPVNSGEAP